MIETEFLFTVAQIAATFAGFSTLVVVVKESNETRGALVRIRLVRMLQQSLVLILFCLIPFLPPYAGLSALHTWSLSSALFCVAWLVLYVHILRSLRSRGLVGRLSRPNKLNVFFVHPVAILALALGGAGFWAHNVAFVYVCGLLVLLYLCGFLFLQQVRAISVEQSSG